MRCFVFALLLPAVFGLRSSPHRLAAHRRRSVAPVSLPLRYHEPSRGHAAALARSHQRARRAIGNNWSWSTDADGDLSIFVTDVERVTVTLAAGQPAPALVAGAARTDVPMPTPIARPSTTPNATVLRLDAAPYDAAFLATVSIGTPPQVRRSTLLVLTAQTFELSIDTGSDVTWVQSSSCTTCGGDDSLDPKSSSTLHVAAESYSVQYGIGSVEGAWASDTLRLGDSVLPDFAMLLVTAAIDSDDSSPYDGLLALSYAASEDTGGSVTPLVQALYDSKQATSRIVGIELRDGGALTLGGVDETRFITLDWMPNQSTYLWVAPGTGITVDGKALSLDGKAQAILDTGTSLALFPPALAQALHAAIPGAQATSTDEPFSYTLPCDARTPISIAINGKAYALDPAHLAYAPTEDDSTLCYSSIAAMDPSLAEALGSDDIWLLGVPFLRSVYLALDSGNNRVGLAALR